MKKRIVFTICFILLLSKVFATENLDNYFNSLKNAQKQVDYTIKFKVTSPNNLYAELLKKIPKGQIPKNLPEKYEFDNIAYIKGNKARVEVKPKFLDSRNTTTIYNGENVYQYENGKNEAVLVTQGINDALEEILQLTPAYSLLNFKPGVLEKNKSNSLKDPVIINSNDSKNGFKCRLIKFGDKREICVSDEYKIAVYEKYKNELLGEVVEKNVYSIYTGPISNFEFELPKEMKIKKLDEVVNELDKTIQSIKQKNTSNYTNDDELKSFQVIDLNN